MFHDTQTTIARLEALRALGIRIAIDDFGTGYSSLGYLRRFQVDILKIAREFIGSADGGSDDWAFARAIVALGRTLGLRVIAEGIEDAGPARPRSASSAASSARATCFARPGDGPSIAAAFLPPAPDRAVPSPAAAGPPGRRRRPARAGRRGPAPTRARQRPETADVHPVRRSHRARRRPRCSGGRPLGARRDPVPLGAARRRRLPRPGRPVLGRRRRAGRRPRAGRCTSASTLLVGAAVLRNLGSPGHARSIVLGAACNMAAILANGGYMPATPEALAALGKAAPTIYSNSAVVAQPGPRAR